MKFFATLTLLFAACTVFAQTPMPSRQVSVSTNAWDYLFPALPHTQSTFDYLDVLLGAWDTRILNNTGLATTNQSDIAAIYPRVGLLETNLAAQTLITLTNGTVSGGSTWNISADDRLLNLSYPTNLLTNVTVNAPGATVSLSNGVAIVDLADSFARGYASLRFLDPAFPAPYVIAEGANTYTVVTNAASVTVTDASVLSRVNGSLVAQTPGTYFVYSGINFSNSVSHYTDAYLYHVLKNDTVATAWPVVLQYGEGTAWRGNLSVVVPTVSSGDYFQVRFSKGGLVDAFTNNLGFFALEAYRMYLNEED